MATFLIRIEYNDFSLVKLDDIVTDCATIFRYVVNATNADDIDISLSGIYENESYTLNSVQTSFTDSVAGLAYNNSLTISFSIANSGSAGVFDSATLTVVNNTVSGVDTLTSTVSRNNDSAKCTNNDVSDFVRYEFITANYTLEDSAAFPGGEITIKNISENDLTISTTGSDLIEGVASLIIYPGESFTITKYSTNNYKIV